MSRVQQHRPSGVLPVIFCFSGAIGLMTGCSSAPGINESTTTVTSTAPSSPASSGPIQTPTPTPTYKPASADGPAENVPLPVMPEAAKVKSKDGLLAFARYWYELVNYGYETGDVSPVQAVTSPNVAGAVSFYEVVSQGYADSDWMGGAHVSVRGLESEYVETVEFRYQAVAEIFQDPFQFYEPYGSSTVMHPDMNPGWQLLEASYTSGAWKLENIVTIEDPSW